MEINLESLEKKRSGHCVTKHLEFEEQGFLFLPDFVNVGLLTEKTKILDTFRIDNQVKDSVTRYNYQDTDFQNTFENLKEKIEKVIGCKLYKTYFFDRIYYEGNELKNHLDRESCEISLTVHIDSNPNNIEWPFFVKSAKNETCSIIMKPGDAVLYKGFERPHWREPLTRSMSEKISDNTVMLYHQIFFHYVLANGLRAHHANDFKN